MRAVFWSALMVFGAGAASGEDIPASVVTEAQGNVMYCLAVMGAETTWPQCAGLMFSPCADHEVGTPEHADCLQAERASWEVALDAQLAQLKPRLTSKGLKELDQVMDGWIKLVSQRCGEVAVTKEGAAQQSAQFGCEISEIAGAVTEFRACELGRSPAPYCVFEE